MNGLAVSDMQWIRENMKNGTLNITQERGSCVVAAMNPLGDAKRM